MSVNLLQEIQSAASPWKSTADVPWWHWVIIAVGAPIGGIIFYLHRNQKFCCKYNPEGLEDRLKFLSTIGLAFFFLAKMFFGPAYFQTLFIEADASAESQIYRYHTLAALLTTVTRLVLSVVQGV